MLKHIGKHNNKKVVVLYRTVPNEDHMCLIAYSDLLPRMMHDEVMKVLESPVGQQAENFADALFRDVMADGRNALAALHHDGLIKKVQTSQVIITPTPNATVRLDELNSILKEMATGEEAIKRLRELDQNQGISGLTRKGEQAKLFQEEAAKTAQATTPPVTPSVVDAPVTEGTVDDRVRELRKQALLKRQDAKDAIAEAQRLELQARDLRAVKHGQTTPIPSEEA
jgi:hypothetical protein